MTDTQLLERLAIIAREVENATTEVRAASRPDDYGEAARHATNAVHDLTEVRDLLAERADLGRVAR